MATDANNLKIAKVTSANKSAFSATIIASGSVYFDETEKRIRVGDGVTPGGVQMAKKEEVDLKQDSQGLLDALKTLIVEYGGTVPQ